jgi:undecaprenyl-diphosphatase
VLLAAFWGLIQGLTEFLPVSSSGHLVLIPALFHLDQPDLATSALLHLGTLVAVVAYFRRDLLGLLKFRTDPQARRILMLLAIGTIPAALVGVALDGPISIVFSEPWMVAVALMVTGAILAFSLLVQNGQRTLSEGRASDAVVVGLAQAFALIPGISRSGMTITAGMAQGMQRAHAARFSFMLAVPAIAGASILEGTDLVRSGGFAPSLLVGVLVAAVVGYATIAALLGVLAKVGLAPFAGYCLAAGATAYFLL